MKCPKCDNANVRKMKEVEDKSKKPLYYSMAGAPVYPKFTRCGMCGNEFYQTE